jgi:hypothetical protein
MRLPLVLASSLLAACNEFTPATPDAAPDGGADSRQDAAPADAGPQCVHERLDLTQVVVTADDTFTGDGSGVGTVIVTDAGVLAEADAGAKNILGLVLTARGFVRRLEFPASTVKIRFETRSEYVTKNAVVGCWIIHVDSRLGFNASQIGFTYGGYLQSHDGDQALRVRAPTNFFEMDHAFVPLRAVGAGAQIIQLESTRKGDDVTYAGALESVDGGLLAPTDGGIAFTSAGLSKLPTEIVCGVSVAKEEAAAKASARWVEIDACP